MNAPLLSSTDKPFIFGIGMNKTGTSSLTAALYELGYPCLHSARTVKRTSRKHKAAGKLPLDGLTEKYLAFCDSPINYMFKDLDAAYPGSKFILTLREEKPWIISRMAQFGGTPALHQRKWREHVQMVRKYFQARPQDILEYDLCKGQGWQPLCQFLGVEVPDTSFPWNNKTGVKRLKRSSKRLK